MRRGKDAPVTVDIKVGSRPEDFIAQCSITVVIFAAAINLSNVASQ
jgi:hypothetical protein